MVGSRAVDVGVEELVEEVAVCAWFIQRGG